MPQIDEATTPTPKTAQEARKPKSAPAQKPGAGIYSFTVNLTEGRITTVERVESGGERRPLTPEEKTALASFTPATPLRRMMEQAFEAGIECVLGEGAGTDAPETKEDTELSSILLRTLIEGSKAKELLKGDSLDRTVIESLIGHVVKASGPVSH